MFGLHPVALGITAGILALMLVAPLIFLALGATGKLSDKLKTDLWVRWKSWLFITPAMIVPVLLGRLWTISALTTLGLLCLREFTRATGLFREKLLIAFVVIGIVLVNFAAADVWYGLFSALSSLTVSVIVIGGLCGDRPKGYIQRVALGVFSFLLFGLCLAHFSYLANDPLGQPLLILILLCVEMNDIFAYCTGKLFGHRKFVPETSPNKTLGGAIGAAVLTTALFAYLAHFVFRGSELDSVGHLALMGFLLSFTGQCGDLVMSSIKRDLGIKDMAATLPGHGGLLDRFDSLLFVGPALFHYIGYFRGIGIDHAARVFTGG